MDLKLQQAIVATRAGRTDIAEHLLTQLIRENPNDANAWFLLGHLVDEPERQSLYLQKTVELDPDHSIAKKRLNQIENPPVPAPVIPRQKSGDVVVELKSDELPQNIPPAEMAPGTAATNDLPERVQYLGNKQSGAASTGNETWQNSAGMPVREAHKASKPAAASSISQNAPSLKPASTRASREVWLVRILVIMVVVAAIVLGILVLLILI